MVPMRLARLAKDSFLEAPRTHELGHKQSYKSRSQFDAQTLGE